MDMYFWIVNAVAVVSTAAFGAILLSYLNINNSNKKLKEKSEELERENIGLKVSLEHEQAALITARLDHEKELKDKSEFFSKELENINARLNESFEKSLNSAKNELLNLNSEKITASSNEIVSKTLEKEIKPLRDEIAKYASENLKLNTAFSTNFESLKSMSLELGKQAETLANALKGNKKAAGNWGESQLDLVLENSGLVLGQNYEKQVYFSDEGGVKRYLDAVVDFGDGKKAIIDAKCSLVHYLEFQNASSEDESKEKAKELAKDIKNHIDTLSSKDYHKFSGAYEYIFMFIPNENMLYTALASDKNLYQYAYEKGIFLCTPLTMLMALRTVYLCWQNLKVDKNSKQIMEIAGAIYDKVYKFTLDYDTLGRQIQKLQKDYDSAKIKLSAGKGNLVKKVEDLKRLGAKISQNLKEIEYNDEEGEITELEINPSEQRKARLELIKNGIPNESNAGIPKENLGIPNSEPKDIEDLLSADDELTNEIMKSIANNEQNNTNENA